MNKLVSPVEVARTPVLKMAGCLTSSPPMERDVEVYSFDQLTVVEGVYRGEQLRSSDEFILGDVFEFSEPHNKLRTSAFGKTERISIEINTFGSVEFSPFSAASIHTLTYMSETGKLLRGCVLDGCRYAINRPSVVLCGKTDLASKYTLIDIFEGPNELDAKMSLQQQVA